MKRMKTVLLSLGVMLLVTGSFAQTQFWGDDFEDVGAPTSGVRTPENNSGSPGIPYASYFVRASNSDISLAFVSYSGFQGSKFWAAEDHDTPFGAGNEEQQIDFTGINISGKSGLSFRGLFAANNQNAPFEASALGFTHDDYMILEYRIDGGAYVELIRFFGNGNVTKLLAEDTNTDGIGDGTVLTTTFQEFTKTISGTGTTLDLRIRCSTNGGNEEMAFDNFRLFETATCTAPTVTANPPNRAICAGNNTTFSIAATGATAYQWQVNTGSGFTNIANGGVYSNATTNTLTITGVTAGMNGYLYRCVAINGAPTCFTNSNSGTLTVSSISTASGAQSNVTCFGGTNGAAAITPSGGVSPYSFSWSPSGGSASIATGLSAGTYTVTVTDNIGCTATRNYTITQPPALAVTAASQTNVACNGGSNGAASVSVSGGTAGYSYNWTPGNPTGDGTASVTGLSAGTWTCTVTDANSCTASANFTITQPTALGLSAASQTNVSCNGAANGAASVNAATGGAGSYTYNWTPGNPTGDGTTSVSGLSAGTWTCTVTDANACTASVNFTITQPTAISLTADSQTNVSCNGGSNGAAAVNAATGGAGSYTYNWTPGNPTGDGTTSVIGLSAGTWTCTVTDANSCTAAVNFTVTQPTALSASVASQTNVSCNGGANGAVTVTTGGGAGGYTYDWTPGNPTGDGTASISGLSAGTYTCTVTDANSCTATVNVTITEPTALSLSAGSQTDVSCNGGSNGAATVNAATGGAGGYTYNWTPGNPTGDGTTSVTGLSAGTWTCTVTDANSCTASVNFTITQPTAISLSANAQTDVSCNGGSNGAASVNAATGGAGGYTYNWTPGNPTGDGTISVTGLSAGTWTCTVTDANSCTASVNFTITQPTAINVSVSSQTDVSCNGGSNGAATVNAATGGAGSYTYDWTPGAPTGDGTTSVTGLSAGTYTCTVTDANSCTATVNVTINEPTVLALSTASQTDVSCNGGSNGVATVNAATGGAGGYVYDWTPGTPTGDGTTSISGLSAGTYTCTVTDANSCTASVNFTITETAGMTFTAASQTNVSCNGGTNGAAEVNAATGGAGGYTYDWTPGTPTGDGTTSISGLSAGTYTCTVTDANSCTASVNFTITEPSALNASGSQTDVSCNGLADGTATMTVTGGTSPFDYAWSPTGGTSATATDLAPGTYTCSITDDNGCTTSGSVTITEPSMLSATTTQTDLDCSGTADGEATITVSGGTSPYDYSWSPSGGSAATATGLAAGTYTCTVTDDNGCELMQDVTITEPAPWTFTTAQTDISCNGAADGEATVTVSGGTAPYDYLWSPMGGTAPTATDLTPGTYTCSVTDATGCTQTQTVTITEPAVLNGFTVSTNVNCNGGSDGVASVTVSGGTAPYDYAWSPVGGTNATASGLEAGTYTCVITDDHMCQITRTVTLIEPALLTISSTVTEISCAGDADGAVSVTAAGGVMPYAYLWTPGNEMTAGISDLSAGTYSVTVTDANGCEVSTTEVLADPAPLNTTVTQNSMTLTAVATGVSYQWINCDTDTPILGATHQSFSAANVGTYAVIISNGTCSDTSACFYLNNVGVSANGTINWSIYPNPAMDVVTITFEGTVADLIVTDASGKQVWSGSIAQGASLSLADFERGIYFFQLQSGSQSGIQRLVKQ